MNPVEYDDPARIVCDICRRSSSACVCDRPRICPGCLAPLGELQDCWDCPGDVIEAPASEGPAPASGTSGD